MKSKQNHTGLAVGALVVLGIAMVVLGAIGMIAPPIITGLGFFIIAWWMRASR